MINIWKDKVNDENSGQVFDSKAKLESAQRLGSSIKKQAFGELKNVMHNQPSVTPFRKSAQLGVFPKAFVEAKTPRSDLLQQFQNKQRKPQLKPATDGKPQNIVAQTAKKAEENLFDCFDFPTMCCKEKCRERGGQLWADNDNSNIDDLLKELKFTPNSDDNNEKDIMFDMPKVEDSDDDIKAMLQMEAQVLSNLSDLHETSFSLEMPDLEDFMFE